MRLLVTTPVAVVAEVDGLAYIRAEDASGAFGIQPGHAPFLTVLAVSVLTWRDRAGREGHLAVRGGVLSVGPASLVRVASREAVAGDDLADLRRNVLAAFRRREEDEREAHAAALRLQLAALRHIHRYLHPEAAPPGGGGFR